MRALLQRVNFASIHVEEKEIARIEEGLVILLGIRRGDCPDDADYLARKCVMLRVFSDQKSSFHLSAQDKKVELLVVSQFTLYGDCRKGRRPNFIDASPAEESLTLYKYFLDVLRQYNVTVKSGKFGADMLVTLQNNGPVTLLVESKK